MGSTSRKIEKKDRRAEEQLIGGGSETPWAVGLANVVGYKILQHHCGDKVVMMVVVVDAFKNTKRAYTRQ